MLLLLQSFKLAMIISNWLPEVQKLPFPYPGPVWGWKSNLLTVKITFNLYICCSLRLSNAKWNHLLIYLWVLGCQSWGVRTLRSTVWPRRHTETLNWSSVSISRSALIAAMEWKISDLLLCNNGEGISMVSATIVCRVERYLEHLTGQGQPDQG